MSKVKTNKQNLKKKIVSPFSNYWKKINYTIFGVGVFLIIVGFWLMSQGPWDNPLSLSYAPLVLLIAYLVIFPLSILFKKKNNDSSNVSS